MPHEATVIPKPFPRTDSTRDVRLVERSEIRTRPNACLRQELNFERVSLLEKRVSKKHAQLLPIVVWKAPNGDLVLIDGWARVAVADRLKLKLLPAVVINRPLEDALVYGLRMNIPHNGSLRPSNDSLYALGILATALGRPVTPEEAESVGLTYCLNEPIDAKSLTWLRCPQFPPAPSAPDETISKPKKTHASSDGKSSRGKFPTTKG
ncbi:ParB N-terminal domain-containing protein [Luteolibacter yonseiensis]|uniref:ParB N-terminal domain-containing protein n=1 Tax=Luteolibacter yonseiensis TaxID=1144680 RepID=A0A934V8K7_9BACT|nr:ParB N-terminal domain-containing protein [Luteolibacter yonseiensis]MBK1817357.1 ParB N-terminal domain-containing protein [Luteolibacter yonseiensis]